MNGSYASGISGGNIVGYYQDASSTVIHGFIAASPRPELSINITGDTLTFTPGEPGFTNYKFKLDPATKPASFSMTHADGTNKGETNKRIYSLDGDHLKICFGRLEKATNELTAKAQSWQVMYSLERKK